MRKLSVCGRAVGLVKAALVTVTGWWWWGDTEVVVRTRSNNQTTFRPERVWDYNNISFIGNSMGYVGICGGEHTWEHAFWSEEIKRKNIHLLGNETKLYLLIGAKNSSMCWGHRVNELDRIPVNLLRREIITKTGTNEHRRYKVSFHYTGSCAESCILCAGVGQGQAQPCFT